jgi:hypothetical protein
MKKNPPDKFTLSSNERYGIVEFLEIVKTMVAERLEMLEDAIGSGESKPDNPNLPTSQALFNQTELLFLKLGDSASAIDLSPEEASLLDRCIYELESERDALENEEGYEEEYERYSEALSAIRAITKRLDKAQYEWPSF